jgi:lactobin A/cerein 7B family class IIb bacteriocin
MRELCMEEVEQVDGGIAPIVVVVGFKVAKALVVGAAAGAGYLAGQAIVESFEE